MSWFSGVVVYVILWWLVFFVTLPFGVRSPADMGEDAGPGHAPSAPVDGRLWIKVGISTAVATVLWGGAYWIIASDLISFRS